MKKTVTAVLALLLVILTTFTAAAATNMLPNTGFDSTSNGKVNDWIEGVYTDTGITTFAVGEGRNGGNSAAIVSTADNDARYEKLIYVKANTTYKFSAYIKTVGVTGTGANISVLETWARSEYLTGDNDWKYIEFYGKTDADTTELIVALRLGYYGGLTSGTVYFDDVSCEKVDSAPSGTSVLSLANYNTSSKTSTETEKTDEQKKVDGYKQTKWIAAIFILACLGMYYYGVYSKKTLAQLDDPKAHKPRFTAILLIVFAAGIALRIWSFGSIPFYTTDFYSCFQGWATTVFTKGPANFYGSTFCDYPPLYILILWPIGMLKSVLGLASNSTAVSALLVTPSVLADVIGAIFVYRIATKKLGDHMGCLCAAAYFLNPAMWLISTGWGQIDSIMALAMVLMVYFLMEKKQLPAFVTFTLGMLLKPQMFFMAPILFFGTANEFFVACKEKKTGAFLKEFFLNLAIAIVAMVAVIFLFTFDFTTGKATQEATWIFEKFAGTIGQYNYLSLNAFNIYALFGGNGVADTPFDMPYWLLSVIAIIVIMVPMFLLNFTKPKKENLPVLAAFIVAAIFMLVPKMHERYLVVAVLLTLYAFLVTRDRRLLYVFFLMSVGSFVNVALVLYSTWILTTFNASLVDVLPNFIAAFNVAWFVYFCFVVYDICIKERIKDFAETVPNRLKAWKEAPAARLADGEEPAKFNMKKFDVILVTAVTVIYAFIAFINLGTTNFPEQMWKPTTLESAVGDLGESTYVKYLYYVGSIGEGKFTVSVSSDGVDWEDKSTVSYVNGDMYEWQYITVNETIRYVRVKTNTLGFSLLELGAVDEEKNPLTITLKEATRTTGEKNATALFDEQGTVPSTPSYYNGMYFDEIYHARTGYEFTQGLTTYETTHPPLGKVFISWGIRIFGMNPFGWRFAGTLAGVLMIPLIYLFAKLLFKKTWIAVLAMAFMTFDGMHFVQTRIATIDSFGVLFIILMYMFMYQYYSMNFYKQKFSKTLVPLGLSGLFFGMGAASKWICLYAGMGLAVIFFYTLYKRYDEYLMAKRALQDGNCPNRAQYEHVVAVFPKYTLYTVGFCVATFLIIPAAIYIASYAYFVPYNKHYGYLRTVWENQKSMFNYHSGLTGDTHPYRSRWYTWPLMLRPMWYYLEPLSDTGMRGTISAFGNPMVWWGGLVMVAMTIRRAITNRKYIDNPLLECKEKTTVAERKSFNSKVVFLLLAMAAQYIPWVFVPRSTFIYHYFATVPFLILFAAATMDYLFRVYRDNTKKVQRIIVILIVIAAVLGLLFYPMWSGVSFSSEFIQSMKWLGTWVF